MASLAEFESALIAERVKAGMARARAEGIRIGRPKVPVEVKHRILSLKRSDPARSVRMIAREVGVSVGTVANCLKKG